MSAPEPLVLGDLTVELWPGDELNEPRVQLDIDAHRVIYDRHYDTEEKVTGWEHLSLEDARKLYDFLGAVLERGGRL